MNYTKITKNRAIYYRLVYIQLIITVVIALISYTFCGWLVAYSVLLGSVVCILPNVYFARNILAQSTLERVAQQTPQSTLRYFYISEGQKFLLAIAMFVICFVLIRPLHALFFFATYTLIMVINLAGLAILFNKDRVIN